MGPPVPRLIPLDAIAPGQLPRVGAKAATLARLARTGVAVPRGFCLTTHAYEDFLTEAALSTRLSMEISRKPLASMRWEELWDTALRIRAGFLARPLPAGLQEEIREAMRALGLSGPLAVRSSAPGEDSASRSFAGLHESVTDVVGEAALEDAIRVVWASLWSDAALLYRVELGLDPLESRMAVLVQEMIEEDRSGVTFARDPRDARREVMLVEAVPGPCRLLVDGAVDPDQWELDRRSHALLSYRRGERLGEGDGAKPLLGDGDLVALAGVVGALEERLGWPPDVEWTGRGERLTILQARPVTTGQIEALSTTAAPPTSVTVEDPRTWYLSLRPGDRELLALRRRVTEEHIPALIRDGERLAGERPEEFDDEALAGNIEARVDRLLSWRQVYRDEFIPFAHGVRRLGTYYNDAVKPVDPYEFVGLLRGQDMLATRRLRAMEELSDLLRSRPRVREVLEGVLAERGEDLEEAELASRLASCDDGADFYARLTELRSRHLDMTFGRKRLLDSPGILLRHLLERAGAHPPEAPGTTSGEPAAEPGPRGRRDTGPVMELERRLLAAVGEGRASEAREMIETGRVSWRLRDDDNILLGRIESQLLRILEVAAARLEARGRLPAGGRLHEEDAGGLAAALRDPDAPVSLAHVEEADEGSTGGATPERPSPDAAPTGESPRQLVGQPASPGVASGPIRRVREAADLGRFRRGEVLVCDAIEPTMTHLVPLAAAVLERRGGMLIHGAIIARELGIPCVNGIARLAERVTDGELVTVDGHLGIVTLGPPEFDLELSARPL